MISELKTSIRSYTILISTTLLALMMAMALVPACGGEQTDTPPSDANRTGQAASTATLAATSTPRPSSGSPSATATATASVPDAARDTEKRAEDQRAVTPTIPPAAATTPITIAAAIPTPTSAVVATPAAGGAGSIDCGDFQTWEDAQQFFIEEDGPDRDEYRLDTDGDGIACNAESDQGAEIQPFEAPESATEPQDATPEPVPAPGRPTVVAAATPEPTPEQTTVSVIRSEAPLREYTPEQIGAVDWEGFAQDGHLFSRASEGQVIRLNLVVDGASVFTELTCGPEIGSSLDARSSQTWSDTNHVVWLWLEDPDNEHELYRRGCIQVSKYEDWPNKKAAPRPGLTAREVDALRADKQGQDLVFFYQVTDRSYTMPPGFLGMQEMVRNDVSIGSLNSDFFEMCWSHQLPNAIWTAERGFVGMPVEDVMRLNDRVEFTEEVFDIMRRAAEAGWYYFHGIDTYGGVGGYGCWRVGNPAEVPVEPCVSCDVGR